MRYFYSLWQRHKQLPYNATRVKVQLSLIVLHLIFEETNVFIFSEDRDDRLVLTMCPAKPEKLLTWNRSL